MGPPASCKAPRRLARAAHRAQTTSAVCCDGRAQRQNVCPLTPCTARAIVLTRGGRGTGATRVSRHVQESGPGQSATVATDAFPARFRDRCALISTDWHPAYPFNPINDRSLTRTMTRTMMPMSVGSVHMR